MKKGFSAMIIAVVMMVCSAQAERTIHVAAGTIDAQTAQEISALLLKETGEIFIPRMEEGGEALTDQVMVGNAPQLAILPVGEAMAWARAGQLLALDGCEAQLGRIARPLANACVIGEELMAAPLFARHRCLAVNLMVKCLYIMAQHLLKRAMHNILMCSQVGVTL